MEVYSIGSGLWTYQLEIWSKLYLFVVKLMRWKGGLGDWWEEGAGDLLLHHEPRHLRDAICPPRHGLKLRQLLERAGPAFEQKVAAPGKPQNAKAAADLQPQAEENFLN